MTVGEWLKQSTQELVQADIGTARLDALVLLEDVMDIDRSKLLAEPSTIISDTKLKKLKKLLNIRASHVPLAYVRGKTEFYGRTFIISESVLEPRPESETMIDVLKELDMMSSKCSIADVGAGSGALGITAALELPNAFITLFELDPNAARIAQLNVDKFTLDIEVIGGNLLEKSTMNYDVLLCNLPYVPDDYHINRAASHEPKLAIYGGPDGLDLYRRLFTQISDRTEKPLYVLTESLPPQHWGLAEIAAKHGYDLQRTADFIQLFKKTV